MSIKGFDASSYQHPNGEAINFAAAKKAGYEFVYIKATEGVGYVNPFFVRDVHAAHQAGLAVGAYLFFHPEGDPVTQANKFHEVVHAAGVHLELPVAIDIENLFGTSTGDAHRHLDTVRTVLRQHGYRTATYSYRDFLDRLVPDTCKFCASDPLWLAGYQAKEPSPPKPWGKVTIWQNYDKANVPGVPSAGEDSDLFEGDAAAFAVFAGRAKPTRTLPSWYHRLLEFPPSKLRDPGHTVVHNGVRYQEGEDVKHVQRKLGIKADGLYGPSTASHVKGFQTRHGLNPDGVVGPRTAKLIG